MSDKTPPIDTKELLEIMDDDDDLLRECFEDFLNDSTELLDQLKDAIVKGEANKVEKLAHSLKGSLKYLAAEQAAEFAGTLEKIGSSSELGRADDVLSELHAECERIREFISNF